MHSQIRTWQDYLEVYAASLKDSDAFWDSVARTHIKWRKPWYQVQDCDYSKGKVDWYLGAELNVSENCLDRHIAAGRGHHRALLWIGNTPGEERSLTYQQLHAEVCKVAHALEKSGIQKGDRVVFYLPNVPELAIGMLACARIGAVHCVIFGGFSAHSIQSRIQDCGAKLLLTADGTSRGTQWIDLQKNVEEALTLGCPTLEQIVVLSNTTQPTTLKAEVPVVSWADWIQGHASHHEAPAHSAQDPLFILYTSGSTGKPKGVLHKMGGYLTYVTYTYQLVFQPRIESDIFWCTADMGWITGHSYLLYGPLASGGTTILYSGVPTYPDPGRFWQEVDRHQVSIFYTAPTAIRVLAAAGDEFVKSHNRTSLRTLGTVGEPINPEAWNWYDQIVGEGKSPIVDTWWQTETGGILISPLAGITPTRPGSACFPLPGIEPKILNEEGQILDPVGPSQGALVLARSWPGQMSGVYGEPDRFFQTYFTQYPNFYCTGDAALRDAEGYYWIQGRTDDVIKVSGHRLGTAEIESACILHPAVVESGAVGIPDAMTGEALVVFVVCNTGKTGDSLEPELVALVRKEVGPLATPKHVFFVPGLPKTRSGKIMRRILKKIATQLHSEVPIQFGDLSTLADPGVVTAILNSLTQKEL